MRQVLAFAAASIFVAGCAHTPDISIYYFPATTAVHVDVTRSLACTPDHQLVSSQVVDAVAINRADITSKPIELDLGLLNSTFANTSFVAELHPDGRLMGINVSETGQANEIIKSAASLAKMVLPAFGIAATADQIFPKLCALIAEEKDAIAILKYQQTFDPAVAPKQSDEWEVPLTSESQYFRAKAIAKNAEIGPLDLIVALTGVNKPNIESQGAKKDGVSFNYPARAYFELRSGKTKLWEGSLPIAQLGKDGWLPIARAPAFGKSTTVIDLHGDGSLKKVSYGSETGATTALGSGAEIADLIKGPGDAERAAAAEAEMTRIKAERALLKCRADPKNCGTP